MKEKETCPECSRPEKYWVGCSHSECPKRRSAQGDLTDTEAYNLGYEPVLGGYRKRATSED